MTSEKQINANRENSKLSTGTGNPDKSRYNALKYGFTSKSLFSEEDSETISNVYEDLSSSLTPQNKIQDFLVGRMAIYIWRLQKSVHIEQRCFANSLIQENNDKIFNDYLEGVNPLKRPDEKETHGGESITPAIELLMRYEVTNENRLIKLINLFKSFK